ncbi:alpha/beta hydrolase fold domain-containing protein [Streptomyces sp. NPDC006923]|uniref:alpha/beta hydrolase fold domain-containing protein n=1 Tax=Streptomyces sp. NPDC006923 TaxID=3155355 RepID=UPI00341189A3
MVSAPFGDEHYLGAISRGGDDVPIYAAPARASVADLTGLAPTWLCTYQLDPTRDEALRFAGRLVQAGVPTEMHHYAGAFHMAHTIPGTAIGARILSDYSGLLWLTPKERLAEACDVDRQTINRVEMGHHATRIDTLLRIAAVVRVPLSDLVREEPRQP